MIPDDSVRDGRHLMNMTPDRMAYQEWYAVTYLRPAMQQIVASWERSWAKRCRDYDAGFSPSQRLNAQP